MLKKNEIENMGGKKVIVNLEHVSLFTIEKD